MAHHLLPSIPDTCFWGYFDARTPAVLHVDSGDEVTVEGLPAALESDLPATQSRLLPEHRPVLEALRADKGATSHLMTGPIHVAGAAPGDVLQVDILEARVRQNWGYAKILPLSGALPGEFPKPEQFAIDIDGEEAVLPWGKRLSLDPFHGIHATAPPLAWGRVGAAQPRAFGGNMDNKELRPGTTLYLPVFNHGALFSVGDGHGLQGDGEVCLCAVETALLGRFRLTVRKDIEAVLPWAETATSLISMGFDADLDAAAKISVRRMIDLICSHSDLTRSEAYLLASLAADFRVTQLVDGEKGIHGVLSKAAL